MSNPMWNLEKTLHQERAKARLLPPLSGTRLEQGEKLIRRLKASAANLRDIAIACENDGDTEGCWFAMASRAHVTRTLAKIEADVEKLRKGSA